jgi:hypothetical protein
MDDLEEANRRLLECTSFDAEEMESALLQRGNAVRAIAASPFPGQAERLRKALDDGRRIRARFAAFYRDADVRLRQIARVQSAGTQQGQGDVSCVA